MKIKTIFVYIIQAYVSKDIEGTMHDVLELQLICDSEKEALKRAKKLAPKREYRLATIIEKEYGSNTR